jgi:hypothetical protein
VAVAAEWDKAEEAALEVSLQLFQVELQQLSTMKHNIQ